jgi:signal transduction histidine kinase
VGAAVVVSLIELLGANADARDQQFPRDLHYGGAVVLLVGTVALALRRRFPIPVLAVTFVSTITYLLAGFPPGPYFLAPTVALFSAVSAGKRTAAGIVAGTGYLAYLAAGWWFAGTLGVPAASRVDLREAIVSGAWLLAVFAIGEAARVKAMQWSEIAKARAEQARARAEQERRQASEERLRIARELHDVLGHHLSLINVQAGVGLHLIDSRPEQAREALAAIKSASSEALREVRSVLGVLRPDEEAAPRAPAPGLDRLPDLTAEAGFPVTVRREGATRPLPAEVDRAAYRIVQEALTNVRRHAGPQVKAEVTVGFETQGVRVTVRDDGSGPPQDRHDQNPHDRGVPEGAIGDQGRHDHGVEGNGIAGMRARAAALGGSLSAGPGDGGGFRVEAVLPVRVDAP